MKARINRVQYGKKSNAKKENISYSFCGGPIRGKKATCESRAHQYTSLRDSIESTTISSSKEQLSSKDPRNSMKNASCFEIPYSQKNACSNSHSVLQPARSSFVNNNQKEKKTKPKECARNKTRLKGSNSKKNLLYDHYINTHIMGIVEEKLLLETKKLHELLKEPLPASRPPAPCPKPTKSFSFIVSHPQKAEIQVLDLSQDSYIEPSNAFLDNSRNSDRKSDSIDEDADIPDEDDIVIPQVKINLPEPSSGCSYNYGNIAPFPAKSMDNYVEKLRKINKKYNSMLGVLHEEKLQHLQHVSRQFLSSEEAEQLTSRTKSRQLMTRYQCVEEDYKISKDLLLKQKELETEELS